MEQTLYRNIGDASTSLVDYIQKRSKGEEKSMKTGYSKLDAVMLNGIEWNTILTIGGMSGSGKSAIANALETNLFDLNKDEEFSVLSFNFEMLDSKQVGRKVSARMQKTVSELYSSEHPLSDSDIEKVKTIVEELRSYDINYINVPCTVDQIKACVLKYFRTIDHNSLIVTLDHTRLVVPKPGQSEKDMLHDLYMSLMYLKKLIAEQGGRVIFIMLSQLNRDIESTERRYKPAGHYPQPSDLFGGSSVYQGSDYVLITHKPVSLQLTSYGPNKLPVLANIEEKQAFIYWHLIKNREGRTGVIPMIDLLKYNTVKESVNHYE